MYRGSSYIYTNVIYRGTDVIYLCTQMCTGVVVHMGKVSMNTVQRCVPAQLINGHPLLSSGWVVVGWVGVVV